MKCAVCGCKVKSRIQWWNRDKCYGICPKCRAEEEAVGVDVNFSYGPEQ